MSKAVLVDTRAATWIAGLSVLGLVASGCGSVSEPATLTDSLTTTTPTAPLTAMKPMQAALVSQSVPSTMGGSAAPPSRVAYVSLSPGSFPTVRSATLRNRRTRIALTVYLVDGGFDPFAILASAGDTISFEPHAQPLETFFAVVPARRQPRVVRIAPASGSRDISFTAPLRVVFSEPMRDDLASGGGVTLRQAGLVVPASVAPIDARNIIFRIVPASPLSGGNEYELVATADNHDMQGNPLQSEARATFSTKMPDPVSLLGGLLLFTKYEERGQRIFSMLPDGINRRHLADGADPEWSPDRSRIAFWRWNEGIFVMNADGSNIRRISSTGYQPTWSPDGSRLAFGCGGICIMNADGTGVDTVTQHDVPQLSQYGGCIRDSDPDWSPDGTTIAFTRWPEDGPSVEGVQCISLGIALLFPLDFWPEIRLVHVDGTLDRALSARGPTGYGGWASWSPDGRRLAYYGAAYGCDAIVVINADGTEAMLIDSSTSFELISGPAWSPDGSRILYSKGKHVVYREPVVNGSVLVPTSLAETDWRYVFWSWTK